MRKILVLFIAAMCFSACSEDNSFMEYSNETLVVNIVKDSVFVNDKGVASVSKDFHKGSGLMINSIVNSFQSLNTKPSNIHLHFNDNDNYGTFYKLIASFAFTGFSGITEFNIGKTNEIPVQVSFANRSNKCENGSNDMLKILLNRSKMSDSEYIEYQLNLMECQRNYLRAIVVLDTRYENVSYTLTTNITSLQSFKTEKELVDAIKKFYAQDVVKSKVDGNKITFITKDSVTMGRIASVMKAIKKMGFP
ncbi:MAG: hypothetical protein MJZ22_03520 [Candidatus Saccharibacteria bacterium]|nr:hypothetical protein [Candidatus Saccharibacteria bacterium]